MKFWIVWIVVFLLSCFLCVLFILDEQDIVYIVVIDGKQYWSKTRPKIDGNSVRIRCDGEDIYIRFNERFTFSHYYTRERWWRK